MIVGVCMTLMGLLYAAAAVPPPNGWESNILMFEFVSPAGYFGTGSANLNSLEVYITSSISLAWKECDAELIIPKSWRRVYAFVDDDPWWNFAILLQISFLDKFSSKSSLNWVTSTCCGRLNTDEFSLGAENINCDSELTA